MKNIFKVTLFSSFMFLTGCLDEILASLCNQLASNNSIITQFTATSDYSQAFAKLTYTNTTTNQTLVVSQCSGDFAFPKGERKTAGGGVVPTVISFITILDDQKRPFFFAGDNQPIADQYTVSIEWHAASDCQDAPLDTQTSAATTLNWQGAIDIPAEVGVLGECEISGESAIISLTE